MSARPLFHVRGLSRFRALALAASSLGFISACAPQIDVGPGGMATSGASPSKSQEQLLAELEENRAKWANVGASDYNFSVKPDCGGCDSSIQQLAVGVEIERSESRRSASVGGFAFSNDDRRAFTNSPALGVSNIDNYFANVRQAILSNQVQNVVYNSQFGYPQNVFLNNGYNSGSDQSFAYNTTSFAFNQPVVIPAQSSIAGVLNYANATAAANNGFWLAQDDGRWNQLRLSPQALNMVQNFSAGSRVQALGRWGVAGANGINVFDVDDLREMQEQAATSFLNGRLNVGFISNPNLSNLQNNLYSYSLLDDDGVITPVSIPATLSNQALTMSGTRVRLAGRSVPTNAMGMPSFIASQLMAIPDVPVQLTGMLSQAGVGFPGATGNTQVWLVDDSGRWNDLRVPASLLPNIQSFGSNARVTVTGVYLTVASANPVVQVSDIRVINNFLTNVSLVGQVQQILPNQYFNNYNNPQTGVVFVVGNGTVYQLQVPNNLFGNSIPGIGSQLQIGGALSYGGYGQGTINVNYLQNLSGTTSVVTVTGTILGRDYALVTNDAYLFQTNDGRILRLRVPAGLATTQPGVTLSNGMVLSVTGSLRSDINELVATQVGYGYTSATASTTTVTGTMINWGYIGSGMQSIILSDDTGRVWQVSYNQSSTVVTPQLSALNPGARLRITGSYGAVLSGTSTTINATMIEVVSATGTYISPTIPFITPVSSVTTGTTTYPYTGIGGTTGFTSTTLTGTVVSFVQSSTLANTVSLRDDNGQTWSVSYQYPGATFLPQWTTLTAGMRVRVSGYSTTTTVAGQAGSFQASIIEVLTQPGTTTYVPGTTGTTTGGIGVFVATITGGGSTVYDPQAGASGLSYVYSAIDTSGRAIQLRITGQTLSTAVSGVSLSAGTRVRVTGIAYGSTNDILVQRLDPA